MHPMKNAPMACPWQGSRQPSMPPCAPDCDFVPIFFMGLGLRPHEATAQNSLKRTHTTLHFTIESFTRAYIPLQRLFSQPAPTT